MKQFAKRSMACLICALLICLLVIPAAQAAETVAQGTCGDRLSPRFTGLKTILIP